MNEINTLGELGNFLEQLSAADQFSGVVLLAKETTPFFQQVYGMAEKNFNVPNHIDTKFNLGSLNKMFTGVAIAQLAEQKQLSFNDPIGTYLPDYPSEIAQRVTIHHLLTHTSGLGSYWNETFEQLRTKLRTIQDFLPLFIYDPLLFQPGEQQHYSNAGFIVLGAIIEHVSGQDYFTYMREHVYQPAGMQNTDAYELDQIVPNLAVGYTYERVLERAEPRLRRNNLLIQVVKGGPAGGGYSTVKDLLKFGVALRHYVLLSPEYTDMVLAGDTYAYGFVHVFEGMRLVGHNGGFPGVSTRFDLYPETGYTVVVLSNYDPPIADQVASTVRDMLLQDHF